MEEERNPMGFELSLPTVARDVSLLRKNEITHMDPGIHMCFLYEKFALSIWEKYMEHVFYDEFLAHMVWLMLDRQVEEKPETVRQLQTVYQTIYQHTREKNVLREVDRIVRTEGIDRREVLLVLREELEQRITETEDVLPRQLYELVERELVREYRDTETMREQETVVRILDRIEAQLMTESEPRGTNPERQTESTMTHTVIRTEPGEVQTEIRTEAPESQAETKAEPPRKQPSTEAEPPEVRTVKETIREHSTEVISHILHRIEERIETETVGTETVTELLRQEEEQLREGHPGEEQPGEEPDGPSAEEREIVSRILRHTTERMREESRERDLTTIDREVIVPMLHRIAEQAGHEVLQTENADRSTVSREVVTAILHRVEEQELREHTDHESREETRETVTRIRQRISEELAQKTSEELTRESVTAILHRIRETEQTRRSPGRAVPADEVTVHTLHRISEEVERELSESEHTELDRKAVTHILNHVKEQVEKESEVLETETADHERVDRVITNRERTDRETAKRETVAHIFHELEEQIGEEFHDENRTTIRSEVIRNLLHRTVDTVETTVRSRVRTQTDREQITQIIHRIERQVAEEWQDVEHITPEAPRRTIFTDRYNRAGEMAIGERALRYTTAAPAQGEWTTGMQTEPGMAGDRTEGPTVQAIRQLDEELSEIREREEDDSTVIMELKNDLKKAAEEIEGLRTQKEAAEAEKIEEKRDVYHEEKVKDLFDNSLRLERLRKGY